MKNTRLRKTIKGIFLFVVFSLLVSAFTGCQISDIKTFFSGEKQPSLKFVKEGDFYALNRFKGTSGHKKFVIPEEYEDKAVVKLNPFSLANAEYLEEIEIGPNIKEIDVYALTNCPKLKHIKVDSDNPHFKDVDGVLYSKNGEELLFFPNMNTKKLVVEPGVVTIRENAFYKCSDLEEISFPDSLKKVGDRAFIKCRGIKKLDLPDGLETIGDDSFSFLHAAEYIYVPATVKSIGNYGFFDATKVEKILMGHKSTEDLEAGRDWNQRKDANIAAGTPLEWGAKR